jgi:hypothetical protein
MDLEPGNGPIGGGTNERSLGWKPGPVGGKVRRRSSCLNKLKKIQINIEPPYKYTMQYIKETYI